MKEAPLRKIGHATFPQLLALRAKLEKLPARDVHAFARSLARGAPFKLVDRAVDRRVAERPIAAGLFDAYRSSAVHDRERPLSLAAFADHYPEGFARPGMFLAANNRDFKAAMASVVTGDDRAVYLRALSRGWLSDRQQEVALPVLSEARFRDVAYRDGFATAGETMASLQALLKWSAGAGRAFQQHILGEGGDVRFLRTGYGDSYAAEALRQCGLPMVASDLRLMDPADRLAWQQRYPLDALPNRPREEPMAETFRVASWDDEWDAQNPPQPGQQTASA